MAEDERQPGDGVRRSRRDARRTSKTSKARAKSVGDTHFDTSMARAMAFNTPAEAKETPAE